MFCGFMFGAAKVGIFWFSGNTSVLDGYTNEELANAKVAFEAIVRH